MVSTSWNEKPRTAKIPTGLRRVCDDRSKQIAGAGVYRWAQASVTAINGRTYVQFKRESITSSRTGITENKESHNFSPGEWFGWYAPFTLY